MTGISVTNNAHPDLPRAPVEGLVSSSFASQSCHHLGVYETLSIQNPLLWPSLTLAGLHLHNSNHLHIHWLQRTLECVSFAFSLPVTPFLAKGELCQVFVALLELSLGFQIFLLELLSHLQIMLDQTAPLNVRCQVMLNLLFLQTVSQGVVLQDSKISAHFLDTRQLGLVDADFSHVGPGVPAAPRRPLPEHSRRRAGP